jgi:hypothetical protein
MTGDVWNGMQCPVCNQVRYTRRDWFKPQWQAGKPVVLGHQSGDYDRCKICYHGSAVMRAAQPGQSYLYDENARALCSATMRLAAAVTRIERFVVAVRENATLVATFKRFGAVTCLLESDPKQVLCRDGRWTFDPRNRNYQKAWWLAWPTQIGNYNANTLGNVIEAIIGMWEAAVLHQHVLAQNVVVKSVACMLSRFCHAVHSFTQYTCTEMWPQNQWLAYVKSLQTN